MSRQYTDHRLPLRLLTSSNVKYSNKFERPAMKKLTDLVVRRINQDVDRWVDSFLSPPVTPTAANTRPPTDGAATSSPEGSRSSTPTPTGTGVPATGDRTAPRCNGHCESGCSTCTQSNNCSRSNSTYNNNLLIRNAPSLYSFSGDSTCDSLNGSPKHTSVAQLAAAGNEWSRSSFSRAIPLLQRARGLLPSIRVHRSSVNGSLKAAASGAGGQVSPSTSGDQLATHAPPRFDDDVALNRVLEMFDDCSLRLLDPAAEHCKFFAQALNVDYVRTIVIELDSKVCIHTSIFLIADLHTRSSIPSSPPLEQTICSLLQLHRELHAVITELTQYQTERKDDPQTIMRTSRLSLKLYFAIKKLVAAMKAVADPAKWVPSRPAHCPAYMRSSYAHCAVFNLQRAATAAALHRLVCRGLRLLARHVPAAVRRASRARARHRQGRTPSSQAN